MVFYRMFVHSFTWSRPVKTPKRTVVKIKEGPFGTIRGQDETGHRTGMLMVYLLICAAEQHANL